MNRVVKRLEGFGVEIVGFGEAGISMIAKKYRFEILMRDASAKQLLKAVYTVDDKLDTRLNRELYRAL